MTENLSFVHPEAPEFLSAAALYSAPIDLEVAVARIAELWNEDLELTWEEMPMESNGGGSILRFVLEGVLVLVTPVPAPVEPERGELPDHEFHVAITCYSPLDRGALPGAESEAIADGEEDLADLPKAVRRRKRALASHVVLTELADALMRERAAIGMLRPELGVVQPPDMVIELADLLSKGQAPLPLWVNIRTYRPDLAYGRTLGLPLFGHLDLEIVESERSEDDIYALLANIADYLIGSDAHIVPGQSVGYREGEELPVAQAVSPADGMPVLRIGF